MKTITVEIPEGKKAEWVNGVLTLVDESVSKVEYKFKVGDKVKDTHVLNNSEVIYTVIKQYAEYGEPMYRLKDTWGETSSAEKWLQLVIQPITERIKTFDDAYEWCLINNTDLCAEYSECKFSVSGKDIHAYFKLRIITAALNEGWEPTFSEEEERWAVSYNVTSRCLDYYPFTCLVPTSLNLLFKSAGLAKYAASKFADIYTDFCTHKK